MMALHDELLARPLAELLGEAAERRIARAGSRISYSRKLFLPVTHLCRDVCRYCVFARPPRKGTPAYLDEAQVLETARRGVELGCREALFTLGDQPEDRWPEARAALDEMGFASTLDYVGHLAQRVFAETGLLPHLNPGLMDEDRIRRMRRVAPSMGIMLESASPRLMERGGAHFGCPDKEPAKRLAMLEAAGRARVPFTTGLLIGIGETRLERLEALSAIAGSHARHGHVQEVIIQPFRAKPGTAMAKAPEPDADELRWTLAVARILLPIDVAIQSPPNLSSDDIVGMIEAGVDDLGGISPLTPDFVNPEAPWPHLDALAQRLARSGYALAQRLTVHPGHVRRAGEWIDPALAARVRQLVDSEGWPREDDWVSGESPEAPTRRARPGGGFAIGTGLPRLLDRVEAGFDADAGEVARLFAARDSMFDAVVEAADRLRRRQVGDVVSFVVTRNINYTNVCSFACSFCAFSKGKVADHLRSAPYVVDLEEVGRRTAEAWARGATEVCLQGGIHPAFDGHSYRSILRAAVEAAPGIHVHAFSPLEIWHGAMSLGMPVQDYLADLRDRGLGTLPGTAAEILDDGVRAILCPDKIDSDTWIDVIRSAHKVGLKTTSTIMFGHVDEASHWAGHLLRLRDLQRDTGGITEFVPLPFVAAEAPLYRRGLSRRGPTWREAVLMHAVGRLVLGRDIPNIQVSWVKMGPAGAAACLEAGANDLGGTLMNESITRSAGARHGQEATPDALAEIARSVGRSMRQRTTLYGEAAPERREAALSAGPLAEVKERPARSWAGRSIRRRQEESA